MFTHRLTAVIKEQITWSCEPVDRDSVDSHDAPLPEHYLLDTQRK